MSPSKSIKCSTCQVQNLASVSACDRFGTVETLGVFTISDLLFISQRKKLQSVINLDLQQEKASINIAERKVVSTIGLLSLDIQDCLKLTAAATKSSSSEFAN